ncbi:hypothetical protein MMC34_001324 [Xylographa carneopallida]|nr:hypothetical protein [Xylographa carneopallida]
MRQTSLPPYLDGFSPRPSCAAADDMQDLVMTSDSEPCGMSALPAHIAARFYRPSRTRRKSSAASSRRNSLSSLHSNRSTRSSHGGPQSTHIAQHLRRASIIESRKARLADKAAHAEQVRLRAALVKAAPRYSTKGEDRALAAQQARERYLAQVAANCADEVKRAKKVAEDMRERKAAEHLKLKEGMEEKFADAEKRRLRYQQTLKRSRFSALQPVEEKKFVLSTWKPRTEEAAVRIIQKAWLNWRRGKIVEQFLQLDLNIASVQKQSFEDLSACLGQESIILKTARVLRACGLQNAENSKLEETTDIRIFLSAFLVFGHPQHVLSQNGEQERDLIWKAKHLLISFEHLLNKSTVGRRFIPYPEQIALVVEAFVDFQTAFTAWKNHDSSILVGTMVAQFVELDAIWQTVKNDTDGHVADDYREGIQQNQTMLLVRLKRLAGPEKALQLVREAVQARRKSRVKKPPPRNIPRGLSGAEESQPATATATVAPSDPREQPQQFKNLAKITHNDMALLISPMPSNRVIVHELAINKEYRVVEIPPSEEFQNASRIIFNQMRRVLAEESNDPWILMLARTVRERLLRVVTPGKSLYALISDTLDLDLLKSQLQVGSFSFEKFFSFMNTILPKLCAPVRDPEVKALAADSGDYISRLEKLLHIINLLSLDFANYQLQVVAPGITSRAAEYEMKYFSEQIKNNKLKNTIRWWGKAHERLSIEASRRVADPTYATLATQLTSDKIYTQGLVDLFISLTPLQDEELPETLELDQARISGIRADMLRIVTVSTILLTAKNLLKRDIRSQWKAEAQRMWDVSTGFEASAPYLSIIESSHALPPSTRTSLLGTIERVLGDARNPQTLTQPVMKVLLQKIRTHVMSRLAANSSEERLRSTTTASEVLAGSGMAEFVGRIGRVVEEMGHVKRVDWAAHGKWLDEVAAEVARDVAAG